MRDPLHTKTYPKALPGASAYVRVFLLALCFCLVGLIAWFQNFSFYTEVVAFFDLARELHTAITALAPLLVVLLANNYPSLLNKRLTLAITLGCLLAATALIPLSLYLANAPLVLLGFTLLAIARTWIQALLYLSLTKLGSMYAVLVAIVGGSAAGEILQIVLVAPDYIMASLGTGMCCLVTLLICYYYSHDLVERISHAPSATALGFSNPESFLKPTHALFFCTILFYVAWGYGLTLNLESNGRDAMIVAALAIVAIALWLCLTKRVNWEDHLFSAAMLLVLAGILTAPFSLFSGLGIPNALIEVGSFCFYTLLAMVVVAVGRRNLFALLPLFGLVRSMRFIGIDIGAVIGHVSTDLSGLDTQLMGMIAVGMALVLLLFLWLFFRRFSFSNVINDVVGIEQVPEVWLKGPLDKRCRELGESHGLTEKEIEVLILFSQGKNARALTEHFVVSLNTIKTHLKHIYLKLDVHSQIELIRLVDGRSQEE